MLLLLQREKSDFLFHLPKCNQFLTFFSFPFTVLEISPFKETMAHCVPGLLRRETCVSVCSQHCGVGGGGGLAYSSTFETASGFLSLPAGEHLEASDGAAAHTSALSPTPTLAHTLPDRHSRGWILIPTHLCPPLQRNSFLPLFFVLFFPIFCSYFTYTLNSMEEDKSFF